MDNQMINERLRKVLDTFPELNDKKQKIALFEFMYPIHFFKLHLTMLTYENYQFLDEFLLKFAQFSPNKSSISKLLGLPGNTNKIDKRIEVLKNIKLLNEVDGVISLTQMGKKSLEKGQIIYNDEKRLVDYGTLIQVDGITKKVLSHDNFLREERFNNSDYININSEIKQINEEEFKRELLLSFKNNNFPDNIIDVNVNSINEIEYHSTKFAAVECLEVNSGNAAVHHIVNFTNDKTTKIKCSYYKDIERDKDGLITFKVKIPNKELKEYFLSKEGDKFTTSINNKEIKLTLEYKFVEHEDLVFSFKTYDDNIINNINKIEEIKTFYGRDKYQKMSSFKNGEIKENKDRIVTDFNFPVYDVLKQVKKKMYTDYFWVSDDKIFLTCTEQNFAEDNVDYNFLVNVILNFVLGYKKYMYVDEIELNKITYYVRMTLNIEDITKDSYLRKYITGRILLILCEIFSNNAAYIKQLKGYRVTEDSLDFISKYRYMIVNKSKLIKKIESDVRKFKSDGGFCFEDLLNKKVGDNKSLNEQLKESIEKLNNKIKHQGV